MRYYCIKIGINTVFPHKSFVAFSRPPTPGEVKRLNVFACGGGGKHVYRNPTRASLARVQRAQLALLDSTQKGRT